MRSKSFLIIILSILIILFVLISFWLDGQSRAVHNSTINIGAYIYIDDQLQEYSDKEPVAVCKNGIYLIANTYNKVMVWREFLDIIGFKYDQHPSVAVLNGENIGDYLDKTINDLDIIVIIAGEYNNFEELINNSLSTTEVGIYRGSRDCLLH